jgi:hypothetical protein
MPPIYQIAIDKNGDNFINMNSAPGDAPNLLPTPVSFAALGCRVEGPASDLRLNRQDTPYGTQYWQVILNTVSNAGFYAGISGVNFTTGAITVIAVTPGQTYTAAVWCRGVVSINDLLRLEIYGQDKALIAARSVPLTASWVQYALSFTPGAGITHVAIALRKPSGAVAMTFEATGFMLVAGSSAPAAFNADDLDDTITPDVLSAEWRLGLERAYDAVAGPTRGQIVVRSADRRYSPEATEAAGMGLLPGRRIRVRAVDGGETITLFDGLIDQVEPAPGALGSQETVIHLTGLDAQLKAARVLIPLQVNTRADVVIFQVMLQPPLNRFETALDVGQSTFAYVGDTWSDGLPALTPIRQVTEAERGRCVVDRAGRLIFYNRDHLRDAVSVTTLDDNFSALDYAYGRGLINQVRVLVQPRAAGAAGSTLWTLESSQAIPGGAENTRQITARLRDANDRPIGATAVIAPVAGVDYAANTQADGSGVNVTAQVSVALTTVNGSAVKLTVTNSHPGTVYLLAGSRLRGTPLIQGDPLLVIREDAAGMTLYGVRPLEFNLPFLVTIDEAEALARYELARRRYPVGQVETITLDRSQHEDAILRRTLFDRVTIRESQTGHAADYWIIAETHRIDQGGERHRCTWTLEPINPGGFWEIGVDALAIGTRLGLRFGL